MAWGIIMKAFPGSFPPNVFNCLSLEELTEAYELAVAFLQIEADAVKAARTN
ncbi:MAG: hypothetical protein Unbinned1312contig1001_32 [Prokaryotic dsDNA virus sp.]|nr:MAG: hypothetical protein Unbinned1312contig1001_32 [Prokaryotic dsDNA virus sp.]|tara:strand:+ start:2040 stop:2195 length:156 start_codon:yes stop_codon:yes gene_type:complete